MKRFNVETVMGIFILFFPLVLRAQQAIPRQIPAYPISISFNKTSNLIFPYAIESVDRGSADVLVQKAEEVNNILQVKAARKKFAETNLTVITVDGRFYSFRVNYASDPSALNLSFEKEQAPILLKDHPADAAAFQQTVNLIKVKEGFLHVHSTAQKMKIRLQGIYLKDGLMYFDIRLNNRSLIDFESDKSKFFIQDRRRAKRTAVQQIEMLPVYQEDLERVSGGQPGQLILAFKPFTILPTQQLIIQIGSQNGSRNVQLKVGHRVLLKARRL